MGQSSQKNSYKLIYVFSMPYETHDGLLKIGEATVSSFLHPRDLIPNCGTLNKAARARIDRYTKTASTIYTLEYTKLAIKSIDDEYSTFFRDKDVHNVLLKSGIKKVQPNGRTGEEWFRTDVETVKRAIRAVKEGKGTVWAVSDVSDYSSYYGRVRQDSEYEYRSVDARGSYSNYSDAYKTVSSDITIEEPFAGSIRSKRSANIVYANYSI